MSQTKIMVIKGSHVGGKFLSNVESGSVSMHVDAFLKDGWRVKETNPDGSIFIEKGDNIRRLEHHDEQEEKEKQEKEAKLGYRLGSWGSSRSR